MRAPRSARRDKELRELMEAIYRVDGASRGGATSVETSAFAGGPWDPKLQHGAAPSSLICWAVERLPSPVPMRVARLTVDLMRPVPVAPLTIETEILREGKKIQLVPVRLLANGTEVVRATALRVAAAARSAPCRAGLDAAARHARRLRYCATRWTAGMAQDAIPQRHLDAHRQRLVPAARPGCGVVSRRPADRRRRADLAADARGDRRRLLQRHLVGPRLHASGPSSTAT